MTARTITATPASPAKTTAMYALLGAGFLVLPFTLPSEAKADDFRISLNLGAPTGYYYQPPVQRIVYAPAPQRIVYVSEPQRVVYQSRPVYRERIVYRDYRNHGHNHGKGHGRDRDRDRDYGRWDDRGDRVAWR